jgi:pyruvate dehydrogenase E1 component
MDGLHQYPGPRVSGTSGHPSSSRLPPCAGGRDDRILCLGVTEYGQSSSLEDDYRLHRIAAASITEAALGLLAR